MRNEAEAWRTYKEVKTRKFLEKALSTMIGVVEETTHDPSLTQRLKGMKDSIILKAIKEML